MIVVTGATGQLGRLIVEKLIARVPVDRVAVSVRDVQKAQDLAARGVRVRRGDFAEPASLAQAFEGATQVLMVSSNAAAHGGDPLAQHRSAIDAARSAGARRIVYTSHMGASPTSAFPPMLDHAATEQMLAGSGLAWTSLRNGFYASSAAFLLERALQAGVFEAPADGKVSWTTHADLAEAAAVVLTNEGRFDGPTPPLTASQALDFGELCDIASDLLGRPIRRSTVSEDEMRAKLVASGMPAPVVGISLGLYRASRDGEFAAVDPTLRRLLEREPVSMRELLAGKLLRARG
ncbi:MULTISPECIES: SDR family oxidoreductase [unclassified Corallococcus]|uniref:SDR family oxidoreductase n=1 Tax=unclassified Corallococcus TaxID=2685029 RepID=UPI001A8C5024|nr:MULTISPECIES: SDR family oxidoreductase [unclassified Corallococcus]MBN9686181.1 SDR family oxidoreductase [Corallococcus sp. NCSPR001]WAS82387.1 SDR family oxidoreductase [Corallococcus sp. NCRR]